jgi:hypothetical protein
LGSNSTGSEVCFLPEDGFPKAPIVSSGHFKVTPQSRPCLFSGSAESGSNSAQGLYGQENLGFNGERYRQGLAGRSSKYLMPKAPTLQTIIQGLNGQLVQFKPIAFILAGPNESGKSTLWNKRLALILQKRLINADRLITPTLPAPGSSRELVCWAAQLRDHDERSQPLAQNGLAIILGLGTDQKMYFGYEAVFSHWEKIPVGTVGSKIDLVADFAAPLTLFYCAVNQYAFSLLTIRS